MDNSKAEEYALLAFFCQWICANKRRLNSSTRCVVMAQDSTSLRGVNTAFRRENCIGVPVKGVNLFHNNENHPLSVS
jgi:hypothetical protein